MNNDLSVYVITHKEVNLDSLKLDSCYKKLMVGKKKNEFKDKKILLDSTGDNISSKNPNYCELTGLYWMWKNDNSKYVGLCHYRRFFTNNRFKIMSKKEIIKRMKNYDIIVPYKAILGKRWTVYSRYKYGHNISDLDLCREIICDKFPEYIESFDNVMNGRKVYFKNMFIMKKELLDDYCKWLFTIFDILETKVDFSNRDNYQKRIYGFLSERLFTVWLEHNSFKLYESVILETESKNINYYIKTLLSILKLY